MKRKWLRALSNLDLMLAVACMAVLICVTFANTLMRYLINKPLIWAEEIDMWMIVWAVSFGGSAVFRHSSHISIDMVVELLPKAAQKVIQAIVFVICVGILGYLFSNSLTFVLQLKTTGRVTSVMSYPQWLVYAAVPAGSLLMMVSYISHTVSEILRGRRENACP